jgi:hypothetical protein
VWKIELSEEVTGWYVALVEHDRAFADRAFDRLGEVGPLLAMPHARSLGDGLRELRFTCEGVSRRITYYFDLDRQAVLLTTFRKQRDNERREVDRARRAKRVDQIKKEDR